jgi:hypothetical protein
VKPDRSRANKSGQLDVLTTILFILKGGGFLGWGKAGRLELRDGKCYRERAYYDSMTLMVQLGLAKLPGGQLFTTTVTRCMPLAPVLKSGRGSG